VESDIKSIGFDQLSCGQVSFSGPKETPSREERQEGKPGTLGIVQGGSDKSGIFFIFFLNGTAQLKII
jgi:hypothetical protein